MSLRRSLLLPQADAAVPNAAFRIAFWTLCCAVTLSLATALLHPETPQFVQHLQGATSDDVDAPIVAVRLGESAPLTMRPTTRVEASNSGADRREGNLRETNPLRTASADPDAALGLVQLEPPQVIAAPDTDEHGRGQVATGKSDDEISPFPPPPPEPVEITRPVPSPQEYLRGLSESIASSGNGVSVPFPEQALNQLRTGLMGIQLTRLERELAELRLGEQERFQVLAQEELASISEQIERLRESVGIEDELPRVAANAEAAPAAPVRSGSRQGLAGASGPRITIKPASTAGEWDIEFQSAELSDVLTSLGERIGWRILVDDGVQGTFTAVFRNANPEQVFAVTLKAHHLRIDRRGEYLLISNR